jgi:hypothetical protein
MFKCPMCKDTFSRQQRLLSHLKRKTPCVASNENRLRQIRIGSKDLKIIQEIHICEYCKKTFGRKDTLTAHIKSYCRKKEKEQENKFIIVEDPSTEKFKEKIESIDMIEKMSILEKEMCLLKLQTNQEIAELKDEKQKINQEIAELKEKTFGVTNNILQVVCVSPNDNYLDMLTERFGNFQQALEYIKNCALSNITGDSKLIEKIYLSQGDFDQVSIRFLDKAKTKVEYLNEKKERVIESKQSFSKKIANNLQNSYLKGVNYLINRNLDNRLCPNKFLKSMFTIRLHYISDLSDQQYQKRMINQLNIPIKNEK